MLGPAHTLGPSAVIEVVRFVVHLPMDRDLEKKTERRTNRSLSVSL